MVAEKIFRASVFLLLQSVRTKLEEFAFSPSQFKCLVLPDGLFAQPIEMGVPPAWPCSIKGNQRDRDNFSILVTSKTAVLARAKNAGTNQLL